MPRTITDAPPDLAGRLDRLANELHAAGVLTDPAWRDALDAAPRHLFIPARAWIHRDGQLVEIDRGRDPAAWWDAVHSHDTPIITQFNDTGPPDGTGRAQSSSSCPAPKIQFQLLGALDVRDGMKVLEIGTGTGWNAALLAHRLGDANAVSVEVDPDITTHARRALAAAGYRPTVERADGSQGYPLAAPYDRIIATCSVTHIPPAWVAQTRPGGMILAPWSLSVGTSGGLVRLTVNPDQTASGPLVGAVSFMQLRQQRRPTGGPPPGIRDAAPAGTITSTTTIDPIEAVIRSNDTAFAARLALGHGDYGLVATGQADNVILWLSDPATGSWARIHTRAPFDNTPLPEGTASTVEQYGPRRLWDEVEAAHRWWRQAGQPPRRRFGLTVTPQAHLVWLDDPSQPIFRLRATPAPDFLPAPR
jgi:protein-L-isoaspartate O-methyltransferase